MIRQGGRCSACGEKLGQLATTEFDHDPALQLRSWDDEERNTVPPANDPDAIKAKHKVCHLEKTTGRSGESRKGDSRSGDVPSIARIKRLAKAEKAFRERLLTKSADETVTEPAKKHRWPSRPFPKRKKDEAPSKRNQKGS